MSEFHAYDNGTYVGLFIGTSAQLAAQGFTSGADPMSTLAGQKDARLNALALRRFEAESGGATIGGTAILTDDKTRSVLTAAYARAKDDVTFSITNYKFAPGVFGPLDNATIIAVAEGVSAHIQACFDNEAAISALIVAASNQTELDAVNLESGWP